MSNPVDRLGHEIKVGSVITYPNRIASALWMSDSVVQEIYEDKLLVMPLFKKDDPSIFQRMSRLANVRALDRVTVIPGVPYYFDKPANKYYLGHQPIVE